jgi:hypothetical protein
MVLFIESIAVRMPTSAMIPKAMIKKVNVVLNLFVRIESADTLRFSTIETFEIIFTDALGI